MNRKLLALSATCIAICAGCQSTDHPWAGEPYKAPSARTLPPQSTYAPMPSILPSMEAAELESPPIQTEDLSKIDLNLLK